MFISFIISAEETGSPFDIMSNISSNYLMNASSKKGAGTWPTAKAGYAGRNEKADMMVDVNAF